MLREVMGVCKREWRLIESSVLEEQEKQKVRRMREVNIECVVWNDGGSAGIEPA